MNKLFNFIVILFCFFNTNFFSQNDSKLSIYNLNALNYNPAYAGSSDGLYVIGIYSSQWVGFEGAPKTQYLAIDTNLKNKKIGLGFTINNDQSGAALNTNIESNFSYTINVNSKLKTTFGAKIGYNSSRIDLDLLKRLDPEESIFGYDKIVNSSLLIGLGLNIYTNNFFIGVSIPNVLTKKYYDPSFRGIIATKRNDFYTIMGYKFNENREFEIIPTVLIKTTAGSKISTLSALNVNWQSKMLAGLNFEPSVSFGAYVGFKVFKDIKTGYAYDHSLQNFSRYNNGSHTFFINYYLENNNSEKCSCKLF